METKQVIVVRKDLKMRKGKICAQVAHASMAILTSYAKIKSLDVLDESKLYMFSTIIDEELKAWLNSSFKKIVVSIDSEEKMFELYNKARDFNIPTYIITDSGLTEFHGKPTNTCIAIGPANENRVDAITGDLKLL